jgi:hypothetical protein
VDNFTWNLCAQSLTPEGFAVTTSRDLGLPLEMGPIIAFKIREALFRHLISCLDGNATNLFAQQRQRPDNENDELRRVASLSFVPSNEYTDMVTSVAKRQKPSSAGDVIVHNPFALLPPDPTGNSFVWREWLSSTSDFVQDSSMVEDKP